MKVDKFARQSAPFCCMRAVTVIKCPEVVSSQGPVILGPRACGLLGSVRVTAVQRWRVARQGVWQARDGFGRTVGRAGSDSLHRAARVLSFILSHWE